MEKNYLINLDKEKEMIPLTFDPMFKGLFIPNKNLFEKLIISALHLENIEEENMPFASNELSKENYKEYSKTVDMNTIIDDNLHIIVEINTENFSDVKLRNFLYQTKLYSNFLESGENPKSLKNRFLFQLILNTRCKNDGEKEKFIVPYDINDKTVYLENFVSVIKFLEVYRELYYNGNREKDVIWMTLLTAKSFTEVYEILGNIVTDEERDKFLKDVIRMNNKESILHEWQKDKLVEVEKTERVSKKSFEDGLEAGERSDFENGEKSGQAKEKIEIAKNMLSKGTDIDYISDVTGLSKEEISSLK